MKPQLEKIRYGLSEFKDSVESSEIVAIDLETTGIKAHESEIVCLSWCTSAVAFGVAAVRHRNFRGVAGATNDPEQDVIDLIRSIHSNPRVTVIYHNAAFDLGFLLQKGWLEEEKIECKIFDTLLASYILNPAKTKEGGKHGLKSLYDEFLRGEKDPPQPDFNALTKSRFEFQDIRFDEAAEYAAFDAWTTFHLYQIFSEYLRQDEGLERYYREIEIPHIFNTIELQRTGLRLLSQSEIRSTGELSSLGEIESELEAITTRIEKILGFRFKLTSPKSVLNALRRVRIRPGKRNERGRVKTSKDSLALAFRNERDEKKKVVIALLIYAKTLLERLKKHEEVYRYRDKPSGRIYPSFKPLTATGRYTAQRPNVLSMGSKSKIKSHIVPEDGKCFVIADFSQIDLRMIANETGLIGDDSKMLRDVNQGKDLHLNTLRIIYGYGNDKWKKITKDSGDNPVAIEMVDGNVDVLTPEELVKIVNQRKAVAKPVNFGISYGLGSKGLAENLNEPKDFQDRILKLAQMCDSDLVQHINLDPPQYYSSQEVDEFLERFHNAYPDIAKFQASVAEDLILNGFTKNIFGRHCRISASAPLRNARMIVQTKGGGWYEVVLAEVKVNENYIDGIVLCASELTCQTRNKAKVRPTKWEFVSMMPVFSFDLPIIRAFIQNNADLDDWHKLVTSCTKCHDKRIEDVLLKSEIPGRTFTTYPFAKIRHKDIKFLYTSHGNSKIQYFGFDKMRRESISYRIQSSSMDVTKIAMTAFRRWAMKEFADERRPRLVNCIHDEIAVECHKDDCELVAKKLHQIMTAVDTYEPYVAPDKQLKVEIGADVRLGKKNYVE